MRAVIAVLLLGFTLLTAQAAVRADIGAINAEGTFDDRAAWLFEGPDGKFGYTQAINGTNETIVVLPPNVPSGMRTVGVELIRHDMEFHGYPLHISLVDKLFGEQQHVAVYAYMGDDARAYEPNTPFGKEDVIRGNRTMQYTVAGPMPASGSIPEQYQPAFQFARNVLAQLNLPAAQKDITHYAVMFVETDDITWAEFAPVWGPSETPHLGCQTTMGRDMVFGYLKHPPEAGKQGGPFLQCL